jgi:xanthine dehydrogenase accessory factor
MDSIFKDAVKKVCSEHPPAALVTIISVKGSTPRNPGAKMLVLPDGRIFGTIGGGCGEAWIIEEARSALLSLTSAIRNIDMTDDVAEGEGMVCGGIMEVFIDILPPGQNESKTLLQEYIHAFENKQSPTLLISVNKDNHSYPLGSKMFFTSNGEKYGNLFETNHEDLLDYLKMYLPSKKCKIITFDQHKFFVDQANTTINLLILGGGHVALPLAKMAKMVGYHVTIIDDRPQFANLERFSEADRVICNNFVDSLKEIDFTPNTYVVIVTRGHRFDKICLREIIDQPTGYIGMIGSRRRVRALKEELHTEGISFDALNKVYSPIGLAINSETPGEIAISILAELINVNRDGNALSLKLS